MALKLTYFNIAARAFPTRVCLAAAGIPFVDERIRFAELQERRGSAGASPAVPLGQLPVLTLPGGAVVTQSSAQWRWAAKKAGLYPRDEAGDERALLIDELVDAVNEFGAKVPQDKDAEAKKAKRAAFVAEGLPKYLGFFSAKLGAGPLFFEGLTVADLVFFQQLHSIKRGQWDFIAPSVLDGWPAIGRFYDAVLAHELVQRHGVAQLG